MNKIPPDCFESLYDWIDYAQKYEKAIPADYKNRFDPDDFNYCLDCTPAYQYLMMHLEKCAHPETKFYRYVYGKEAEIIGSRQQIEQKNMFEITESISIANG